MLFTIDNGGRPCEYAKFIHIRIHSIKNNHVDGPAKVDWHIYERIKQFFNQYKKIIQKIKTLVSSLIKSVRG